MAEPVRAIRPPVELVHLLSEVGAWGVNLHDNDLVPIDATPSEHDKIVKDFKAACAAGGIVVPMATVILLLHAVSRRSVHRKRSRGACIRRAEQMRAMDLGAELGAKIFVLWADAKARKPTRAGNQKKL